MYKKIFGIALMIIVIMVICGCGKRTNDSVTAKVDKPIEVVVQDSQEIKANVYIDGTYSMNGYVNFPETTIYMDAVKGIERTITGTWTKDNISYYRFGDYNRRLSRDEFLNFGKVSFYNQVDTSLQDVVSAFPAEGLNILVTDLFQTNQDIESLIIALKRKGLSDEHKALAIMGLKSQFSGKIYDIGKRMETVEYRSEGNNVDTYRPFYFLVLGNTEDVRRFVNNFKRYSECKVDVKTAFFTKHIGKGKLVLGNKKNNGKDQASPMANIFSILGPNTGVPQFKLHYDKLESKGSFELRSDNVIGQYCGDYELCVDKVERWAENRDKKQDQKSEQSVGKFVSISANGLLNKVKFPSSFDNGFVIPIEIRVRPKGIIMEKGIYRVKFSMLSKSDYYWGENFNDWNFEDGDNKNTVGMKTLNIKRFVKMLGDLNARVNAPGFYNLYVYFDVVK